MLYTPAIKISGGSTIQAGSHGLLNGNFSSMIQSSKLVDNRSLKNLYMPPPDLEYKKHKRNEQKREIVKIEISN